MIKLLALLAAVLAVGMTVGTGLPNLRSAADDLRRETVKLPAYHAPARIPERPASKNVRLRPAPAARPPQPPPSAVAPSGAAMNDDEFWQLIDQTRQAAGNDTGRQSELLKERLAHLPAQSIVQFDRIRHRLDAGAYTSDLWAAAYVIQDGCSDDCFRDFRSYLISLGRGPYEAALRDPDSLAGVAQDAETGNWEGADNVAPDAYSSVTGRDFPSDESDLSGNPRGKPFDENDLSALAGRYPRLFARFR